MFHIMKSRLDVLVQQVSRFTRVVFTIKVNLAKISLLKDRGQNKVLVIRRKLGMLS